MKNPAYKPLIISVICALLAVFLFIVWSKKVAFKSTLFLTDIMGVFLIALFVCFLLNFLVNSIGKLKQKNNSIYAQRASLSSKLLLGTALLFVVSQIVMAVLGINLTVQISDTRPPASESFTVKTGCSLGEKCDFHNYTQEFYANLCSNNQVVVYFHAQATCGDEFTYWCGKKPTCKPNEHLTYEVIEPRRRSTVPFGGCFSSTARLRCLND